MSILLQSTKKHFQFRENSLTNGDTTFLIIKNKTQNLKNFFLVNIATFYRMNSNSQL